MFTLTVNPVNDAPTIDDFAGTTAEDTDFVTLNGPDIDALTFLASVSANGSASVINSNARCRL